MCASRYALRAVLVLVHLSVTPAFASEPPAPIVADPLSFPVYGSNGSGIGLGEPAVWDFLVGDTGGDPADIYTNIASRGLVKFRISSLAPDPALKATLRLILEESVRDQYPKPGIVDDTSPFENPNLGSTFVVHIGDYGGYTNDAVLAYAASSIGNDPGVIVLAGARPGAVVTVDVSAAVMQAIAENREYVAFRIQTQAETDWDALNDLWLFESAANPDVTKRPTLLFGPQPLPVVIDIRPDNGQNAINLDSSRSVPVAILSAAGFDALQIDPDSIRVAGAAVRLMGKGDRFACRANDADGDGLPDLVCSVSTAAFLIEPGESLVQLDAATTAGVAVSGADWIRIVP